MTDRTLIRAIVRFVDSSLPLGSFDDDPGGPWIGPGVPCHCAAGQPEACIGRKCPHHLANRPGWEEHNGAG